MASVQNTSSLTVVAKSFKTHRDLTSFPFIRRAQPASKMDLPGGTPASLTQEYSCRSFICVSLYFCRQEVRQSTHPLRAKSLVSVWPILSVDIGFQLVSTMNVKDVSRASCFLGHVFFGVGFQRMRNCKCSERSALIHLTCRILNSRDTRIHIG